MSEVVRNTSAFTWNEKTSRAAIGLASGKTQREVAADADVTDRTLRRWLEHPEFSAEVDRLSLMVANAGRAYRLRIANRVIGQIVKDEQKVKTDKDLLDWLKYAQSETDGVKLGIGAEVAAILHDATSVARGGSN